MPYMPDMKCPTPSCIERADKGEHRVADTTYRKHPCCESCGGELIDGAWVHKCKMCGTIVEPGQLSGLFVPHLCDTCIAIRRANDHKCSMCRKPMIDCCC
jgi:hypothetical protein